MCRTGEGVSYVTVMEGMLQTHLLTVKDIVVFPILADGETLVQAAVFVSLGKKPWSVHEVLAFTK